MPTLTGSTTIPYQNGRELILSVSGGAMTIKRYLSDKTTTVECDGSPIADGDEVSIKSNSANGELHLTAGTGGMDYQYAYSDDY